MPRLALLLTFFASVASAAPAPVARKEGTANAGAWSEPVGGLRVRLVAQSKKSKAGEPLRVTLEVQNAGPDRLSVEPPCLSPLVGAPGTHSYRGECFPWAIFCDSARQTKRRGEKRSAVAAPCLLPPGGTLRIQLAITPKAEGEVSDLEESRKEMPEGEDRREDLKFDGQIRPGVYVFRVSFSREPNGKKVRKGEWAGKALKSPPLTIEVVE